MLNSCLASPLMSAPSEVAAKRIRIVLIVFYSLDITYSRSVKNVLFLNVPATMVEMFWPINLMQAMDL